MLSQQVEAHLLHRANIVYHGIIGGRSEQAIGIVSLVKNSVLKTWFMVQIELHSTPDICFHRVVPHASVAFYRVLAEANLQIIERRTLRAPGVHFS